MNGAARLVTRSIDIEIVVFEYRATEKSCVLRPLPQEAELMSNTALPSRAKIVAFWDWFCECRPDLERMLDGGDIHGSEQSIGAAIEDVSSGRLGWELGPGSSQEYMFALTLNGNIDNSRVSKAIVELSPKDIPNWEFHFARPPKVWDFTFSMTNKQHRSVEIDAKNWSYALTGYGGGEFFDVTVVAHGMEEMDDVARQQAAGIAIQGSIGEVAFLRKIGRICVLESATGLEDRLSAFCHFAEHLISLSPD
jgi:hypothetical protein